MFREVDMRGISMGDFEHLEAPGGVGTTGRGLGPTGRRTTRKLG